MSIGLETKPAILGGRAAVTIDQQKAARWPLITEEDEREVLEVLRGGNLSFDPVTQALERDWCEFTAMRHALAHCNGTAALLAAFFAIGLERGDEVLVPSATFWASVVPMLWVGAIPVFCESETQRLGIDPEDAERKITARTKAIVIVHLWGMPSRAEELMALARRHQLKVVEDASHAPGASLNQRNCGSFGDISVFSLQTGKLAPAGEGGIFLTNDQKYLERAICLGDFERALKLTGPARRFAGTTFGIKTRMAALSAAVARVQLRRLPERNARRRENLIYLSRKIERPGVGTFLPPAGVERVYFEYMVHYDATRFELPIGGLVAALRAEGCEAELPRYPLLHQQPLFTEGHFARIAGLEGRADLPVYRPDALPLTEAAAKEFIRFPAFAAASLELMDQYAEAWDKVLSHSGDIGMLLKAAPG
jgi:perosamine synthetase